MVDGNTRKSDFLIVRVKEMDFKLFGVSYCYDLGNEFREMARGYIIVIYYNCV